MQQRVNKDLKERSTLAGKVLEVLQRGKHLQAGCK